MRLFQTLLAVSLTATLGITSMEPLLAEGLRPNENLVVEGVPEIPLSLVGTVKRYTEFRAAGLQSWHPTRQEMLITTRFADVAQIHQVRSPLAARKQLTFLPEAPSGASYQPTTGEYFVFSKDVGGSEFNQNYRYDLATGEMTLLTDGKSRNSRGIWSNQGDGLRPIGGHRMAYTSTRRTGKDNDIYLIDPKNPETNRLLAKVEGGGWSPIAWSPDDRQLLVLEYVSINESYLWLLDAQTGAKTLVTPKGRDLVSYQGATFSKDGKGLYLISDRESEFQRLAYYDLSAKTYSYLASRIPWDVEDFDLSKDGKSLAFVTNEDGTSVLHVLDTATRQEKPLPKLPIGQVFGITWHSNNRDLGFSLTSARSSTDVYSLNMATGKVDRWTESETGGLNTTGFSEPSLVRWPSFDKTSISGFLYRPPAKFIGKRPVVINIHGGPEGQFRPSFLGRNNYYLNEMGVALLFPNVRGSSGYGKTFLKLDNGTLREDSVKDIGALLDWIKTQPDLDADRVLVTGGSYGGYMSLAVATNYSDRIRAAIDIVGISNFVTFLERTEGYRRDLRRVEYGDERDPKMREFLLKISPLNNASKIKKPLFVIHGKNDPRVPLQEAEQIAATVRQGNTPVWYLMATDEGHGFGKKKNVDFQFYATVMFMQQFLLTSSTP